MGNVVEVKRLKKILVVAVLAFWLPATNHCRLELIPGLEFLDCCGHSGDEQASDHQENKCADDLCAQVEHSLYKAESSRVVVESPPVSPLAILPALIVHWPSPERVGAVRLNPSPPELPKPWQFSYRAAAPPRAPSFVS
jgi:hypothetical protein